MSIIDNGGKNIIEISFSKKNIILGSNSIKLSVLSGSRNTEAQHIFEGHLGFKSAVSVDFQYGLYADADAIVNIYFIKKNDELNNVKITSENEFNFDLQDNGRSIKNYLHSYFDAEKNYSNQFAFSAGSHNLKLIFNGQSIASTTFNISNVIADVAPVNGSAKITNLKLTDNIYALTADITIDISKMPSFAKNRIKYCKIGNDRIQIYDKTSDAVVLTNIVFNINSNESSKMFELLDENYNVVSYNYLALFEAMEKYAKTEQERLENSNTTYYKKPYFSEILLQDNYIIGDNMKVSFKINQNNSNLSNFKYEVQWYDGNKSSGSLIADNYINLEYLLKTGYTNSSSEVFFNFKIIDLNGNVIDEQKMVKTAVNPNGIILLTPENDKIINDTMEIFSWKCNVSYRDYRITIYNQDGTFILKEHRVYSALSNADIMNLIIPIIRNQGNPNPNLNLSWEV